MTTQYIRYPALGSGGGVTVGSAVTGGTAGSVLFVDGSGNLGQDNTHFFWDPSLLSLGIGNGAPQALLHISDGNAISASITPGLGSLYRIIQSANSGTRIALVSNSASISDALLVSSSVTTPGDASALGSNATILSIRGRIFDNSSLSQATASEIRMSLDGAPTGSGANLPSTIKFFVNNGTSSVQKLQIKNDGTVTVANFTTAGVVQTDASGNLSSATALQAQTLLNLFVLGKVTAFTSSGTFTTPSTSSTSTVYGYTVIGAGGGGGAASQATGSAGGGGAGALAIGTFTGISPSTGITITVSSSGGAGGTTAATGTTGSSSIIGTPVSITATGGVGGTGNAGTGSVAGGTGGTVTVGSPSISQAGAAGHAAGSSTTILGGNGAGSCFGGGAAGGVPGSGAGVASVVFGAGGGGGCATSSGGAGGPGLIVITQLTA